MSSDKPSAGAINTARRVFHRFAVPWYGPALADDDPRLVEAATMIEDETGLGDLVEAAEWGAQRLEEAHKNTGGDGHPKAAVAIRAALAKVEGTR